MVGDGTGQQSKTMEKSAVFLDDDDKEKRVWRAPENR